MKRKAAVAAVSWLRPRALALALASRGAGPERATAASHREAPLISQDPCGDVTDFYAFVSPDKPDTVTIIADWIPFEEPVGRPELVRLLDQRSYDINVDNTGDGKAGRHLRFTVQDTQAGASGACRSAASPARARRTRSRASRAARRRRSLIATCPVAPNNIGPRTSRTGYRRSWRLRVKDSAGRRAWSSPAPPTTRSTATSARPSTSSASATTSATKGGGKDAFAGFNVHVTALQLPKSLLQELASDVDRRLGGVVPPSVTTVKGKKVKTVVWRQVSRLGNPLTNELLIPTTKKDEWNGDLAVG